MYEINFIANAIGEKYERFLIPFTFFALLTNEKSYVEIVVVNSKKFKELYKKELIQLKKINNNFLIRKLQYKLNKTMPNTYRFFEVPTIKAKYTYIADIDIMFLEEILPNYLSHWPDHLPYNNKLRNKKRNQLTGVMLVINDKYYTDEFKKCQKKYYNKNMYNNDEVILGEMCKEIHGVPNFNHKFRPILGIHFSPNRGPNKGMNLGTNKKYYNIFNSFKEKYPKMFTFKIFTELIDSLEKEFIIK